jgi:hypothetical protein
MTKINPLFIVMRALERGTAIFPEVAPDQIYKIFTPEELEEGEPGLYWCHKSDQDQWRLADHITVDYLVKMAYRMSEQDLITMAANNALTDIYAKKAAKRREHEGEE